MPANMQNMQAKTQVLKYESVSWQQATAEHNVGKLMLNPCIQVENRK